MKSRTKWILFAVLPIAIVVIIYFLLDPNSFNGKNKSASVFSLPTTSFGTTVNLAVFAGSTISNTRPTSITGDFGNRSAGATTGFFGTALNDGPGIITGTVHENDAVTTQATTDTTNSYLAIQSAVGTPTVPLALTIGTGYILDGLTLTPGVYDAPSGSQPIVLRNGATLTLDGTSDPTAAFIIRGGKAINFLANSQVQLINTTACNVFWLNEFDVTIDGGAIVNGSIFTAGKVRAQAGSSTGPIIYGRLIGRNIELDWATIIAPTCTPRGSLTVIKEVVNSYGGTATPADFMMTVTGGSVSPTGSFPGDAAGTTVTLDAGSYSVDELNVAGYTKTMSADCSGTIAAGEAKICTITNTQDEPTGTLTVIKNVVGGTKSPSDFMMHVIPSSLLASLMPEFHFPGDSSGTTVSLVAGVGYATTETPVTGYVQQKSGDCDIFSVEAGSTYTCTITNTFSASRGGTLRVIKRVIGGVRDASSFTINVTGRNVSTASFPGDALGTTVTLNAGSYSVDEIPVSGYTRTLSADCSGTIADGETKTCTITNTSSLDLPATLIVIEKIIGGTARPSDFSVAITSTNVVPIPAFLGEDTPGTSRTLTPGAYSVQDQATSSISGYTRTMSTDCSGTISLGETKICTITRELDTICSTCGTKASLIVIKKVVNSRASPTSFTLTVDGENASPARFPGESSGTIITLDPGAYSVNELSAPGFTKSLSADCSGTIAANETKTCTITNTKRTTGDPLTQSINVEKTALPTNLAVGGGLVTYTYAVTNTGDSALSNIQIADNKCRSITFLSGDTHDNGDLNTDERWTYQCTARLTQTTTNVVSVSGEAGGKVVEDTDEATVTVQTNKTEPKEPTFPTTGFPPR